MKVTMINYMKTPIKRDERLRQEATLTQTLFVRLTGDFTTFCMMHPPVLIAPASHKEDTAKTKEDKTFRLVARDYSYNRLLHTSSGDQELPAIIVEEGEVDSVLRAEADELEMICGAKKKAHRGSRLAKKT